MKIFKKNCIDCKHCLKHRNPSSYKYYGFTCGKKNYYFDYDIRTVIRGAFCAHYKKHEVK